MLSYKDHRHDNQEVFSPCCVFQATLTVQSTQYDTTGHKFPFTFLPTIHSHSVQDLFVQGDQLPVTLSPLPHSSPSKE